MNSPGGFFPPESLGHCVSGALPVCPSASTRGVADRADARCPAGPVTLPPAANEPGSPVPEAPCSQPRLSGSLF